MPEEVEPLLGALPDTDADTDPEIEELEQSHSPGN